MRGVRVRVVGRVQGVGFRAFVWRRARERGLSGWVRNLADGDVEAEGWGSVETIEAWLDDLRRGPAAARVVRVETTELQGEPERSGFAIEDW